MIFKNLVAFGKATPQTKIYLVPQGSSLQDSENFVVVSTLLFEQIIKGHFYSA